MTYELIDQSIDSGTPVNVYAITIDGVTYRYTDDARPVTLAGNVYEPRQINRTTIINTSKLDDRSRFAISLPINDPVSLIMTALLSPIVVRLEVWEVHLNDPDLEPRKLIMGLVSGVETEDETVTLTVSSMLMEFISVVIPTRMYSRDCNWAFGDSHCGYDKSLTAYAGLTIVGINLWTIEISGLIPNEAEYDGGTVTNLRTGTTQTVVDVNGTTVFTVGGFANAEIGDSVTFFKGCDHSITGDCAKYGNQARFGGFPHVPRKNPFLKGFGEYQYGGGGEY